MSLLTLPTEVFYRILDFVDVRDILMRLRRTCRRFHAIVKNYDRLNVDLTDERDPSKVKRLLRLVRPENVRSWSFNIDKNVMRYYYNDFLRFATIDSRIRSVTIGEKGSDPWSPEILTLVHSIINLPNLRQLTLDFPLGLMRMINWPESFKIQQLTLRRCNYSVWCHIFDRSVHLEDFHLLDQIHGDIHRSIRPNTSRSLTSLKLGYVHSSIDNLFYFLSQHENLRSLQLSCVDEVIEPADEYFQRWEHFLRSTLPNLKHFDLRVFGHPLLWRNIESVLRPLTSSFWLEEKRWFFTARYEKRIIVSSWTPEKRSFPSHLEPKQISYSVTTQRANDTKRQRSMWAARVNLNTVLNVIDLNEFDVPDRFYFRHVTQLALDVPEKLCLSSENIQQLCEWIDLSHIRDLWIFDWSLKTLQTTSFSALLEKTTRLETLGFCYNDYEKRIIELAPIIDRCVQHLIIRDASFRCIRTTIKVIKRVPMITFENVSGRRAIIKYLESTSHRFYGFDQSRSIEFHRSRKRKYGRNND